MARMACLYDSHGSHGSHGSLARTLSKLPVVCEKGHVLFIISSGITFHSIHKRVYEQRLGLLKDKCIMS